ncbi:MAG: hypothetical protein ACMUIE_01610 [Thermoplasmatota archaeon]
MRKYLFLALIMLLGAAAVAGCLGSDDDEVENGEEWTIAINGVDFKKSEIFEEYDLHEVTDSKGDTYEGVYLKELLEDAGVSDLSAYTYRITAADDSPYIKEVTHLDMEEGILIEEETRTIFPDLPGKYKVKDVVEIEPLTDGDTITVNGKYWTWMQPFDILEEAEMYDNESNAYTGIRLSDLVNYTALENPQEHNYTIMSGDEDGYEKEVTWNDMMNGLLVDDEHKTMFPHLRKSYWVKNVAEILVV